MMRNGKWTIFASSSAELSGSDVAGCVSPRKHLPICAVWIEPMLAVSNEASATWRSSTSRRLQRPSVFQSVSCSGEFEPSGTA